MMRLPAFGAQVASLRRQGLDPASGAVVVRLDTWPPKDRPESVAVPQVVCSADVSPSDLDLRFLEGLDVQIAYWPAASSPERLRALTRQALAVNPRRLWVLNVERGRWRIVKSVERGQEVAV